MQCPKCNYVRQKTDTAPSWQCPSCGISYEKFQAEQFRVQESMRSGRTLVVRKEPSLFSFRNIFLLLLLAGVGWAVVKYDALSKLLRKGSAGPTFQVEADPKLRGVVIMYSLTTCGHCTVMRGELQSRGIKFREYFLDTQPWAMDELTGKLQAAGMMGGGIGTPTVEVNGRLMLNNPPLRDVLKALET